MIVHSTCVTVVPLCSLIIIYNKAIHSCEYAYTHMYTSIYIYMTYMHTRVLTHTHTHTHTHTCTHICTHTFPSGETAKYVTISSSYKHYLIIEENKITVSHFFQMPCYSTSFTIHYLHTYSTSQYHVISTRTQPTKSYIVRHVTAKRGDHKSGRPETT